LDVGVGFYRCGLSVRVYEATRTACIVDTQSRSGAAIISLKSNPAWAKVLDTAADGETVDVDGFIYEVDLMRVNGLKLKNGDLTEKFSKGIIYPKAYDYNCRHVFREPYFGKETELAVEHPYIIKTGQINEYQIYQRGYTFTVGHDNIDAWADGRLRIEVRSVYKEDVDKYDYRHEVTVYNQSRKEQYDKVRLLEDGDENYLIRLELAITHAWYNGERDVLETVKREFANSWYTDFD
jgi:hypothetical protein